MLLGQARGKMGSIVFFVRDGIQQQRPHNPEPKNPRTISQMFQRVKLAAVVGFYKRQAAFFRFALKKKAKESYYNAFVRYNLNISPYFTKEQAASGISCPAPYIIADGNMPRINIRKTTISGLTNLNLVTSIPASITTWGAFRRAYDLVMGDMLSLVVFNCPDDDLDPTKRIVVQHRFDAESENMPLGYDMVGTKWGNDGSFATITVNSPYFGLNEFFATGSAIVLSRNNGAVDCSYAQLELDEEAMALYQEYRTDAQREMAALSYGQESNAILDPKQFEGNYVDMVELYETDELKTKVSRLSFQLGESQIIYYDPEKWPSVGSIDFTQLSGVDNMDSVVLENEGEVSVSASEDIVGTGVYRLIFTSSSGNHMADAILTLTTTSA